MDLPHQVVCPRHDDWSCAGGPPKLMGDELPGLRGNLILGSDRLRVRSDSRPRTGYGASLEIRPKLLVLPGAYCRSHPASSGFGVLVVRCSDSGLVPVRAAISTRPSDVERLGRWTDVREACACLRPGVTARDPCSTESQIAASVDLAEEGSDGRALHSDSEKAKWLVGKMAQA